MVRNPWSRKGSAGSARTAAIALLLGVGPALAAIPGTVLPALAETPPVVEWLDRYTGSSTGNNQVNATVVDRQGCTYVTGNSSGDGWDIATVKYSPGGRQLAVARFDGPAGMDDVPYAISLDSEGNVLVAGYTDGDEQSRGDLVAIKYDSTLVETWHRTYAGQFNLGVDEAFAIAADGQGNVYVAGSVYEAATNNDFLTIKYDAAGTRQWVQQYNGPGNFDDGARALVLDSDANVYVTGFGSRSAGNYDATTIKYSSSGVQQWIRTYDGPADQDDGAIKIALDSSRNVYVTGYSTGIGTLFDVLTLKYDADGHPIWARTFDEAGGYDAAYDLALDAGANAYVTGYASFNQPRTQSDYVTIKYGADGVQKWVRTYDGPVSGFDEARSVAVDAGGNVYVTGYSDEGTSLVNYDYATVKYDSTGTELWAVRYNGPGDAIDVATGLALDPQGSVVVAGWSTGTRGTAVDYATIKYDQEGAASVASGTTAAPGTRLLTIAPDPFSLSARLDLDLPGGADVDLGVYGPDGAIVLTPLHGFMSAGEHQFALSAARLPPGVYFYRLRAGSRVEAGKLVRGK